MENANGMVIFDRKRLRMHRNRVASSLANHDFILKEAAIRLHDRLESFERSYNLVLDLGGRTGLLPAISCKQLVATDIAENMLKRLENANKLLVDEEYLPFKLKSLDLILSVLNLHWVNDLPGCLLQCRQLLQSNGIFLASLWGGETLKELREAVVAYAAESGKGFSPRVSPFIDVKDAGMLLQRAGFSMPVADSEIITVTYDSPLELLQDLHGMGEANCLVQGQKHLTSRGDLAGIAKAYVRLYGDNEGKVDATFEIVTMTGVVV